MTDTEDSIAAFRARIAGEHVTPKETPQKRVTKKRDTETPTKKKRVGERWLNLISGQVYKWNGRVWKPTGEYPHGPDPMGFING